MSDKHKLSGGGRLQISVIALVFFGPLVFATWMYATGNLRPAGTTNHGEILSPPVNLGMTLPSNDSGAWRLIYINTSECDQSCNDALYRMRQVRLMLGSEMDRVSRVFLHGAYLPDTVLADKQQTGLITIIDTGLAEMLKDSRPTGLPDGGLYLVDPLDNLMMYFSPVVDPGDLVDDLKHLLQLSRIG